MVLPLLDRVLIRETNTLDLKSYQDTDDDGVADRVELVHKGGPRGGNLEHQPSGLVWNVDNWLYTAMSAFRYRVVNGRVISERMPASSGQWGLTHDNVGRLFYSFAGGENPAGDFQRPLVYGQIRLPGEQAPGFREVFPIDNIPDTQGGRGRLRANNTLNRFTASCGQSIFRGDRRQGDQRSRQDRGLQRIRQTGIHRRSRPEFSADQQRHRSRRLPVSGGHVSRHHSGRQLGP